MADRWLQSSRDSMAARRRRGLPALRALLRAARRPSRGAWRWICAGCHAYNVRLIGPPALVIKAQYGNDAQAIADYVANPVRKRPDFPSMPPQGHISDEMRLLVAEHMLGLEN